MTHFDSSNAGNVSDWRLDILNRHAEAALRIAFERELDDYEAEDQGLYRATLDEVLEAAREEAGDPPDDMMTLGLEPR